MEGLKEYILQKDFPDTLRGGRDTRRSMNIIMKSLLRTAPDSVRLRLAPGTNPASVRRTGIKRFR